MKGLKKCILICGLFFSMTKMSGQDLGHVFVQGHPDFSYGFGGGAALELGYPVKRSDYLVFEPGVEFFGNKGQWIYIFPILTGYRYLLNRKEYGIYFQPMLGYTIGSTAIKETKTTGDTVNAKANGFTAGLGIGYIFKTFLRGDGIELRYTRDFITNDPQISILSIRLLVYTIPLKRRMAQ
jgi:hypothetical protein